MSKVVNEKHERSAAEKRRKEETATKAKNMKTIFFGGNETRLVTRKKIHLVLFFHSLNLFYLILFFFILEKKKLIVIEKWNLKEKSLQSRAIIFILGFKLIGFEKRERKKSRTVIWCRTLSARNNSSSSWLT